MGQTRELRREQGEGEGSSCLVEEVHLEDLGLGGVTIDLPPQGTGGCVQPGVGTQSLTLMLSNMGPLLGSVGVDGTELASVSDGRPCSQQGQ